MSFSLILTNCLFCGFAALILVPILRCPNSLTYKKGIPIFVIIILIFFKLLIPHEYSFTHTLASKNILPVIYRITHFNLIKNITIGTIFSWIWFSVMILMLTQVTINHQN